LKKRYHWMNAPPKLIIFDVGHGSCVFLHDGAITTVIDCKNSTLLIDFLLSQNIRVITQIIISHADADHIDGILALIQSDYIQLGTVFVNADANKDSDTWMALRIALQDASTRGKLKVRTEIGDGMADQLQSGAVQIEVVAPGIASRLAGPGGRTPQRLRASSNAMSVVLRLHHNNHPVILIPGDLDSVGLADLIARGKDLGCDILLFPHHGGHIGHGGSPAARMQSNATFTKMIIGQVNPQLVLFSIGRGHFSTPRPEIVQEIHTSVAGCRIRCTQLSEHCQREISDRPASHLAALPALGRNGNQCCGGSLEIFFAGKNTVDKLDQSQHANFVSNAVSTPLCRSPLTKNSRAR
jgi:beta-lactamase superfamily II metal-dependent hydrolase